MTPVNDLPVDADTSTLKTMLIQECTRYRMKEYLHNYTYNDPVDIGVRQQLIDWMMRARKIGNYSIDTVEMAVSTLDRFAVTDKGTQMLVLHNPREQYQLAAVTALYVTAKAHEETLFSAATLALESEGQYTIQDIEYMEREMMTALHWNINPPTTMAFVKEIVYLLPCHTFSPFAKQSILTLAQNDIEELFLQKDYKLMLSVKKSVIALAAVVNIVGEFNIDYDVPALLHETGILSSCLQHASSVEEGLCVVQDYLEYISNNNDSSSDGESDSSSWHCLTRNLLPPFFYRPPSPRSTALWDLNTRKNY